MTQVFSRDTRSLLARDPKPSRRMIRILTEQDQSHRARRSISSRPNTEVIRGDDDGDPPTRTASCRLETGVVCREDLVHTGEDPSLRARRPTSSAEMIVLFAPEHRGHRA